MNESHLLTENAKTVGGSLVTVLPGRISACALVCSIWEGGTKYSFWGGRFNLLFLVSPLFQPVCTYPCQANIPRKLPLAS